MTFLPIVERELRVRARLKSTYRFRLFGALGAILLVGFLLVLAEGFAAPGSFGGGMFNILAWVSFLYCLTDGARNTADCLSEEKRAGTLGLLFLTDLRAYDVVLGKLMATSLNSFYGLLAIFPPLAIPLVIGGVTPGEFWRLVLVLLNTLFFSLTIGLLVSAASRDERNAWTGTVGLGLFFAAVPPLLLLSPNWRASFAAALSPTTAFLGLFDGPYTAAPDRFWAAVRNIHLLSWLFLAGASVILPRAWQDRPLRPRKGVDAGVTYLEPNANARAKAWRERLLDGNPVVWLAAREQRRRWFVWALAGTAAATALAGWLVGTPMGPWLLLLTVFIPFLILAMWVASEACHLFAGTRDSGALELLLCTPLTAKEIVTGHFLGLRLMFFRPVMALVAVEVSLLLAQLYAMAVSGSTPWQCGLVFGVVGLQMLVSVMDLYAVAQFGMWMGLSSTRPAKAVTKTVLYVMVLPMVGVCSTFLWPVIGIVKNLIFINYAREQMRRRFRAIATEHYGIAEEPQIVGQPSRRAAAQRLPSVLPR